MASDLLDAQTSLQNYAFSYVVPMSLKCAVELGIPTIIHNYGQPISLRDLATALHIPATKSPNLRRLMRLLTHSNFFSSTVDADNEVFYSLTHISHLLVNNIPNLSPFLLLALSPVMVDPFHSMAAWFIGDTQTPFEEAHDCGFWEKTNQSPQFNEIFNAGMASDSKFLVNVLVKECGQVFEGVRSLVDVGGGTGTVVRAIKEAFPGMECSVLDLAHVIEAAPKNGSVKFIPGDMFEHVPPADAILLKWILHDWSDEDCVTILKRCREAIPAREKGGKVIIIDLVVGSKNSNPKSFETQLYFDMMMMVMFRGAERENHEWRKLFMDAGFSDYKITPALGLRSVIELYP